MALQRSRSVSVCGQAGVGCVSYVYNTVTYLNGVHSSSTRPGYSSDRRLQLCRRYNSSIIPPRLQRPGRRGCVGGKSVHMEASTLVGLWCIICAVGEGRRRQISINLSVEGRPRVARQAVRRPWTLVFAQTTPPFFSPAHADQCVELKRCLFPSISPGLYTRCTAGQSTCALSRVRSQRGAQKKKNTKRNSNHWCHTTRIISSNKWFAV